MFSIEYLTGKKPLWRAFWIYAFAIPFLGQLFTTEFNVLVLNRLMQYGVSFNLMNGLLNGMTIMNAGLCLFGLIAVWRCAANCKRPIFTWLARLFCIVAVGLAIQKWMWFIHFSKDNILQQIFKVTSVWLFAALCVLSVVWSYAGAKANKLGTLVIPSLILTIFLSQIVLQTVYRPLPVLVLIGQNGDLSLRYNFTYSDIKKVAQKSIAKQMPELEISAQKGDASAAYTLGALYMDPQNPAPNDNEAVRWLRYAADHGVTFAKNDLGIMYHLGRGVEKNTKTALKLYREGSEAGDDIATYNLGLMHEMGDGTPVNYEMAAKYYQQAVQRLSDNPDGGCAENDLGALYATGKGVKQSDVEARSLFADAARKDYIIILPAKELGLKIPADIDFPNIYASFRLSQIKHQSKNVSDLSPQELKLAKYVADRFQNRCRA